MAAEYKKAAKNKGHDDQMYHGVVLFGDPEKLSDKQYGHLAKLAKERVKFNDAPVKAGGFVAFDRDGSCRVAVVNPPAKGTEVFRWLTLARKVIGEMNRRGTTNILFDLSGVKAESLQAAIDGFVSATTAFHWDMPEYGKRTKDSKPFKPVLHIMGDGWEKTAKSAAIVTAGTNMARRLTALPTNELTCAKYIKEMRALAKREGLKVSVTTYAQLEKSGAGAFCAVARGSDHADAGVVKLTYEPTKKTKKRVAVVGKGIVYDTGGVNVKTGNYMFGMHGDMGGSAVAVGTILVAAREKWPVNVTAYLAIAENAIGSRAFLPNEVVTALDGTSIEVVHTDAEGRMVLADTLCIASKDKPDMILDFATLTGSAVRAIGTRRSCGFTNRDEMHAAIADASKRSGERVWSFPHDDIDAEALKSQVADTKQCKLSGAVDHIEAACFLGRFVGKDIPWVHVDLSASEHEGGLAHVGTAVTGFGVRFARELLLTNSI